MAFPLHDRGARPKPLPGQGLDPTDSLGATVVSAWALGEGTGTALSEAGFLANRFVLQASPSWVAGGLTPAGLGVDFSGAGQYAAADRAGGVGAGSFTLFALARPGALGSVQNLIRQDNGTPRRIYGLRLDATNHFTCLIFDGSTVTTATSSTVFTVGSLYSVVGVRDGARGTLAIAVNGVIEQTVAAVTVSLETPGQTLNLARDPSTGGTAEHYLGALFLVGLANAAWTPRQVADFTADPYRMFLPPRATRAFSAVAAAFHPFNPRVVAPALGPPAY